MKRILNYFAILIASISIFGCAKIDNSDRVGRITNSNGEYAILFSNSPATKATNVNGVATYNEFALYTWNSNNEVVMNSFTVNKTENGYVYDGVNSQTIQYFKNNADNYTFIGVIPTTGFTFNENKVTGNVKSFTIDDNRASSTITADSPNEFLYAYKNVEKPDYKNDVTLNFKHGNALLYLGFISDAANTKILDYVPERTTPSTTTPNPQNGELTGTAWGRTSTAVGAVITQEDIDYINGLFTYTGNLTFTYGDGVTLTTTDNVNGYFQEALGIKDYLISKHPTLSSVSDAFMNSFTNFYLVHIEKNGNEVCGWFYNKKRGSVSSVSAYTETTTPGATISAIDGIRVFSAKTDATNGYAHIEHTMTADAIVSTDLLFTNRVTSSDVIQFALPTTNVPVGTTEADAIYSPTTFYAIPGDTDLSHFVVKVSYEYKGQKVYDVRVPIALPTVGLESGKYYKYIINITSTGNGTNDPNEADPDADEIDIVNNPINVIVDVTDYSNGHTQIITI